MSRLAAAFALPLMLLVPAGCDSPTGARLADDVYALTSVGGEPVPTILFAFEGTTVLVLADTLRFSSHAPGTHVRHQEVTQTSDPGSPRVQRYESEFGYRITGDRIEISYVCPPLANCVPGPHLTGVITDGTIRLDAHGPGNAGAPVYELVDEA